MGTDIGSFLARQGFVLGREDLEAVVAVRLTEKGPVFAHVRKSEMPGTHGAISADSFHAAIRPEDTEPAREISRAVFRRAARLTAAHLAAFQEKGKDHGAPRQAWQNL